jgi:DNA modification methylase
MSVRGQRAKVPITLKSELAIEWWPIARPKPYPANARKLSTRAIETLAKSLKEFGWRQPIVVDLKDVIVAGHTRLLAAQACQMTQVPVHVARELTPAQIRAYRIMDNRSADETEWDMPTLEAELAELAVLEVDLSTTGFDEGELAEMLTPEGLEDEDEVLEVPAVPTTKVGDVWLLGKHRVVCGDATAADAVARACGPTKPALMVTDPPYGVDYDPAGRLDSGVNKPWQKTAKDTVTNDSRAGWTPAWKLFAGSVAYVWHSGLHAAEVQVSLQAAGFDVRAQIIWAKPVLVMSRGAYHWQHEPCYYAVRKGATATWAGDRKQTTLWSVPNMHRTQGDVDEGHTVHSIQKPVELMRRPIVNHTKGGAAIYDPFLGSGSTLIACEKTGRVCVGLELAPAYVDVIILRWQAFTGNAATLEGDGRTFEKITAARAKKAAA